MSKRRGAKAKPAKPAAAKSAAAKSAAAKPALEAEAEAEAEPEAEAELEPEAEAEAEAEAEPEAEADSDSDSVAGSAGDPSLDQPAERAFARGDYATARSLVRGSDADGELARQLSPDRGALLVGLVCFVAIAVLFAYYVVAH